VIPKASTGFLAPLETGLLHANMKVIESVTSKPMLARVSWPEVASYTEKSKNSAPLP